MKKLFSFIRRIKVGLSAFLAETSDYDLARKTQPSNPIGSGSTRAVHRNPDNPQSADELTEELENTDSNNHSILVVTEVINYDKKSDRS